MNLPTRNVRSRLVSWWSPKRQTDLMQMVKAVVAAALAWALAEMWLDLAQAFLAPWVALLAVRANVYRTFWSGAQTVLAVAAGILVSFVVVELLTATVWSFGVALLAGLALGRLRVFRDEGATIATTALFVITTGYDSSEQQAVALLPERLLDTAIGVLVALVVDLAVYPPLADRSAQQQVDDVDRRLGGLLADMADGMRRARQPQDGDEDDWIERTRSIDEDVQHAWSLVRGAQESRRWNPRGRRRTGQVHDYPHVLARLEEGVSQARSIARHLRESGSEAQEWDPRFRTRYVELLAETGRRVADPDAEVATLRTDLGALADDLSDDHLPGRSWPLYGALIASLQVIVDVVDDVATARPVRT